MCFLESKSVPIKGGAVTLTQLSGLDRLGYMEFCASRSDGPEMPTPIAKDASAKAQREFVREQARVHRFWTVAELECQARMVAYGIKRNEAYAGKSLDDVYKLVLCDMPQELIAKLHWEVAELSGMLPQKDEVSPVDAEAQESASPKK